MPYTDPKQSVINAINERAFDLTGKTLAEFEQWILRPFPKGILELIDQQQITFVIADKVVKLPNIPNQIYVPPRACNPIDLFQVANLTLSRQNYVDILSDSHPLHEILEHTHYPHTLAHTHLMRRIAQKIAGLPAPGLPNFTKGYDIICHQDSIPRFFLISTKDSVIEITHALGTLPNIRINNHPCHQLPLHQLNVTHTKEGVSTPLSYVVSELLCDLPIQPKRLVPVRASNSVNNTAFALGAYIRDCEPVILQASKTSVRQSRATKKIKTASSLLHQNKQTQRATAISFSPFLLGFLFHLVNTATDNIIRYTGSQALKYGKSICIALLSFATFILAPTEAIKFVLAHQLLTLCFKQLEKAYRSQRHQHHTHHALNKFITYLVSSILYACLNDDESEVSFEAVLTTSLFNYLQLLLAENLGAYSGASISAFMEFNHQPTYHPPIELTLLTRLGMQLGHQTHHASSLCIQSLSSKLKHLYHSQKVTLPGQTNTRQVESQTEPTTIDKTPRTKKRRKKKKKNNKHAQIAAIQTDEPCATALHHNDDRLDPIATHQITSSVIKELETIHIYLSLTFHLNIHNTGLPHTLMINETPTNQAIVKYRDPNAYFLLHAAHHLLRCIRLLQRSEQRAIQALPITHPFGKKFDISSITIKDKKAVLTICIEVKDRIPPRAITVLKYLGLNSIITGGTALRFAEAAFGVKPQFDIDHSDLDYCVTQADFNKIKEKCKQNKIRYEEISYTTYDDKTNTRTIHPKLVLKIGNIPPIDITLLPGLTPHEHTLPYKALDQAQREKAAAAGLKDRHCGIKALSLFIDPTTQTCQLIFPQARILQEILDKRICSLPYNHMRPDWPLLYAMMVGYTLGPNEVNYIKQSLGNEFQRISGFRKLDCLLRLSQQPGDYIQWLYNHTTFIKENSLYREERLLNLLLNINVYQQDQLTPRINLIKTLHPYLSKNRYFTEIQRLSIHLLVLWGERLIGGLLNRLTQHPPTAVNCNALRSDLLLAIVTTVDVLVEQHLKIDIARLKHDIKSKQNGYLLAKYSQVVALSACITDTIALSIFPNYTPKYDISHLKPISQQLVAEGSFLKNSIFNLIEKLRLIEHSDSQTRQNHPSSIQQAMFHPQTIPSRYPPHNPHRHAQHYR